MTKTKKLSLRLGVLLLAVLVVLGGFAVTRASAEGEAGSFVGYRNVGQEWQGKYGKDGYLVFSGTPDGGTTTSGSYVYTDLYGDEYTEAFTGSRPSSKLFSATDSNLTYTGDSSAAPAIADDAPVSDWGVTSETFMWHNDMKNVSLFDPVGGFTGLRLHNTRDVLNQSVSVYFTAETAGYVSVYAFSYGKYAGSETMTVSLYAGNNMETIFPSKSVSQDNVAAADADTVESQLTEQLAATFESYDIDAYYGGTSGAPLATVPITLRSDNNYVVGRYVTFYVETPGQYQIVAYRTDYDYTVSRNSDYVDGGTLTVTASPAAAGIVPSIGGLFFDAADPTVTTASYTGQRDIGQNWVGEYGGEGYILLSGSTDGTMDTSGRYFYSDLYGAEYTGAFKPDKWYNYMSSVDNNVTYNGEAAPALSADAPISDWGMTSEAYLGHNDTGDTALFLPDGVTTTRLRMHNTQDSINQSVSMYFRLKAPGYVSAYVFSYSAAAGDIDVALYAGNQTGKLEITKNVSSEGNVTEENYAEAFAALSAEIESRIAALPTLDAFYGGTPLAETTVVMPAGRTPGRMVTFYISEPGDYQIVAYHTDTEYRIVESAWTDGGTLRVAGEPASGTPAPSIGGLFFDSYDRSKIASFSSADTETNGYWEDMYGKDGYILFGVDDATEAGDPYTTTERIAYTKGIYATDGKVTMDDDTLEVGNTSDGAQEFGIVEDYAMTNAFVSRYVAYYQDWGWPTWQEPGNDGYGADAAKRIAGDGQLKLPGNPDDYIRGRMILSANDRPGSIAFTLTEEAFAEHDVVYVSVYHNQVADGLTDVGDVTFVSRLYNTYLSTDKPEVWAEYEPIAETEVVRAGGNGGLYVTYAVTKPGDYSIYLIGSYLDGDNAEQPVRGSIEGLFFDYADPSDTEITRYDITYHLPDGAVNGANPATYVAGRGVSSFAPASMAGYTFDGWFDAEDGGSQVTSLPSDSTGDKDLYGRFTPNPTHTITYIVENGTNADSNPATYTEGIAVTFADPTPEEHYTFVGWFTEAGGQGDKVTGIPADSTGDVTVYAYFTESPNHAVTYVLPAGAVNDPANPDKFYEGEGIASLAPATMDGYTFEGWYADESFDTAISAIPPTMKNDVTVYAKFVKNAVVSNITYHLDGGENASSNPETYTEGTAVVLADAEKEGYTFLGWYTSADFAEGTTVTAISADSTGDVELWARFEAETPVDPGDDDDDPSTDPGDDPSTDPGDDDDDPTTDPGDGDTDPTPPDGGDDAADDGCGCGGALGFGTGAGAAALLLTAGAAFMLFRRKKA